ncbi:hypothetical protein [Myceligenerans pegani]|uniref:Uncharacterized protein n=1 Tax=Myceligenerans pegani TaxID=2776917 RepID=A0ABR9N012_9MICO|nr:hypothetical protein [Myceligenerans sp. TRM 65318]MBE1876685.1 hypothetical protein [Myceligenerans sp. TRM 65318]MBE3018956.1 hypothetical protein [Myceligenerans sp. TRM 65318]
MTAARAMGLTAFGCGPDETVLFSWIGPLLGVRPAVTDVAPAEANAGMAAGYQHQSPEGVILHIVAIRLPESALPFVHRADPTLSTVPAHDPQEMIR